MGIKQKQTEVHERPERTKTPYTPKFLAESESIVDEYAPPIKMQPYKNGYHPNLVSPKLWPESTEFVTGYPKKQQARSIYYSRESTLSSSSRPRTQGSALKVQKKREETDEHLMALSFMERSGEILNRPMTQKTAMERQWSDRIDRVGTASLRASMKNHLMHERVEPQTLMDTTDRLKYSGSTAYIVHSQSTDDLRFKQMMERIHQTSNFPMRWRQISIQIQFLKRRMKRDESMADIILLTAITLRREAIKYGNETQLSRLNFINAMQKVPHFEQVQESQLSLLFSTFDTLKKDRIRFADILVGLAILDRPNDACIDKLVSVWGIYDKFGSDMPRLDLVETILLSCASSDEDVHKIQNEFRNHFRPFIYKQVLQASLNPVKAMQDEMDVIKKKVDTPKTKASYYSVIDTVMEKESAFREILEKSPKMISMVDDQLSERLIAFYGKDSRRSQTPSTPQVSSSFLHMLDAPKTSDQIDSLTSTLK